MYDLATYFAWFVLALLFCVAIAIIVAVGSLPKKIAIRRNHPQVAAINAASWIGLALFGLGWPIAFVWAFLRTDLTDDNTDFTASSSQRAKPQPASRKEIEQLRRNVEELRAELESLKGAGDQQA